MAILKIRDENGEVHDIPVIVGPQGKQGDTGATPQLSFVVTTGAAGTQAEVTQITGTPENPVIHMTIPRGAAGSIDNLTINGKPVTSGTIVLTAQDIEARPDTWTPTAQEVGAEPKKLAFADVSVPESSFEADATYADYPFRAQIALKGVTAGMYPEVIFSPSDAIGGNYAPVCAAYDGGVYVYAKSAPAEAATVPTVICWKGVSA